MVKLQGCRIVFQKTACGEACVFRKLQGSMDENAFGAGKNVVLGELDAAGVAEGSA
jgi:hypothetical protein